MSPSPRSVAISLRDDISEGSFRGVLFLTAFLPEPTFVGVRGVAVRSGTLRGARCIKLDRRIGLGFGRFQRERLSRRPLSRRSNGCGGFGGLMFQAPQIPVGAGRRCWTRYGLADGHAASRGLLSASRGLLSVRRLNLECVVLLRHCAHADTRQCDRNRQ